MFNFYFFNFFGIFALKKKENMSSKQKKTKTFEIFKRTEGLREIQSGKKEFSPQTQGAYAIILNFI